MPLPCACQAVEIAAKTAQQRQVQFQQALRGSSALSGGGKLEEGLSPLPLKLGTSDESLIC